MGWAVGYDPRWRRDIGYGVPAKCDHPECETSIDRGLGYVCGGEPWGGDLGCGLHFCGGHLLHGEKDAQVCARCDADQEPFSPKPDVAEWTAHKLMDESWSDWRAQNPEEVARLEEARS